jgi:hypothetical protein
MRGNEMEWISVEDGLPEQDGKYLVYDFGGDLHVICFEGSYWKENDDYWGWCSMSTQSYITHWMPLPKPPN